MFLDVSAPESQEMLPLALHCPTQVRLALASGKPDIKEESHVLIEEVALG